MNNKEKLLKFIKDFNGIGITDVLNDLNMNSSAFYTYEYSLDNMQKITNEVRKQLKTLYNDLEDNNFILNTKEKNVNFIKDIKDIRTNYICENMRISRGTLYNYTASESKYELVINEIKKQLDEVYQKYNQI